MVDLVSLVVHIIIQSIIIAPILWIAGRGLADKENVKFFDAIWIVVLGNLITYLLVYLLAGVIPYLGVLVSVLNLVIWLGLIKHFFKTGWFKALTIAIMAIIVFIILALVLSFLGFGVAFITGVL